MEIVELIALICGGLGLFLFGVTYLSNNLKILANGDTFRRTVSKATNNRLKSFGIGTGFTALIQSSGGTSALSIGLVKANAMSYESAIAVIIGANVGTCITAFLIAIPGISKFMPFITFLAALTLMMFKNRKVQQISKMVFGFSLIFFGILLIETNVKNAIKGKEWFENLMYFMNNYPWVGLLFGTVVTCALQSSSAVIGVVQGIFAASVAAAREVGQIPLITLYGIIPLVIGANIGAVIPSILTAVGGGATAKRVAFTNTFMKVAAALLFMILSYPLKDGLTNSYNWGLDTKLQVAIFHLIFNVASAAIFLPLLKPLCKLSEKVIKDDKSYGKKIEFKELDPKVIQTFPSTGISLAFDLSNKMFDYASTMFKTLDDYLVDFDQTKKEYTEQLEKAIDHIDRHLADFLIHAETGRLTHTDHLKYNRIMRAIKDIERIGDYGDNLANFYMNIKEKKEELDQQQKNELGFATKTAITLIGKTMKVYTEADAQLALEVIQERRDMIQTLEQYQEAYFIREKNKKDVERSSYTSLVYVDILNSYERVYAHCANIAKLFNNDKVINKNSKSDEKRFASMSSRY